MITLTPAYGRDFKNGKEAEANFRAGKDWVVADVMHRYAGSYCSIKDLAGETVKLRFKKNANFKVIKL